MTNLAQGSRTGIDRSGTVWDMKKIKQYFLEQLNTDWDEVMWPRVERLIATILETIKLSNFHSNLDPKRSGEMQDNFIISGWDIIIDRETLHPWLMEVNFMPDMTNVSRLSGMKYDLWDNAMSLVLDPTIRCTSTEGYEVLSMAQYANIASLAGSLGERNSTRFDKNRRPNLKTCILPERVGGFRFVTPITW